jgi:predicted DNA-binding WGR domain protein
MYALLVAPTLWGTLALIKRWGRIGASRPRELALEFATEAEAETAFRREARHRRQRGYRRTRADED